jgi:hypothetical protein
MKWKFNSHYGTNNSKGHEKELKYVYLAYNLRFLADISFIDEMGF